MKKYYTLVLAILLYMPLYGQISPAMDARLQSILDSVCKKHHIKGTSAAVLIPGMGIWEGVNGESHTGQPITTSMQFGIGSNTKTYIAALMLKMQENSMLDLDDTIGTWIQNEPNINGQVTIRQLLRHRSGIYNFTDNPDFHATLNNDFHAIWQPEDVLQFIKSPVFAPGMGYQYSNSNYVIAGLIIKKIYNQPVSTVLHSTILQPNNLNETTLSPEEPLATSAPNVWSIYFPQPYLENITADYNYSHNAIFSMAWTAGAIMATAEDNVKFWHSLMAGNIINNASLQEMKEFKPIPSSYKKYGLGLFRLPSFNGRTVYSHGGTNAGYINENIVDSITGTCISVLTNQDSVSNAVLSLSVIAALHAATLVPVSVQQQAADNDGIFIYPNPAKGSIGVTNPGSTPVTLHLTDMGGKTILTEQVPTGIARIELTGIAPGAYLLYGGGIDEEWRFIQKLIVY